MNDNKSLIASGIIAVSVIALACAFVWTGRSNVQTTLTVDGKPVSVVVDGKPVNLTVPQGDQNVSVPVSSSDPQPYAMPNSFGTNAGETTYWEGGQFNQDLVVGGVLSITGTSTFSGNVEGAAKSTEQSFALTTSTACAIQNNSTSTRLVAALSVVDRGLASSTGDIRWNVGTSTSPYIINGRSSVSTTLARVDSVDVILTTSTQNTAAANTQMSAFGYFQWRKAEYINFISNTTSNIGRCVITEL